MKHFRHALAAVLAFGGLLSGCNTTPGDPSSHWNVDSVDNRIIRHFTGYRGAVDGTYLEFQLEKKNHINKTLRRHFLNNNPDNPFQAKDPAANAPRRNYGPLPNPVQWFHLESVLLGSVLSGWGTFFLLPFDSLVALTSPGGFGEFGRTFIGDWGSTTSSPPKPSTFEVKNR